MALAPYFKQFKDDSASLIWDLGNLTAIRQSQTVRLALKEGPVEIDVDFWNGYDQDGDVYKPTVTVKRFVASRPFEELSHVSAMLCCSDPSSINKKSVVVYYVQVRNLGEAAGIMSSLFRVPWSFCLCMDLGGIGPVPMGWKWDKGRCDTERFTKWAELFASSSDYSDVTIVSMDDVEIPVGLNDFSSCFFPSLGIRSPR